MFGKIIGAVMGVAMAIAYDVIEAFKDNILDGSEIARITKSGFQGLRVAGVSQAELDMIQVATTRQEYEALDFKDGDVLVYGPQELTSKLKIKV